MIWKKILSKDSFFSVQALGINFFECKFLLHYVTRQIYFNQHTLGREPD